MISYIIGEVVSKDLDGIVIENNGIGYFVATSDSTMSHFQVGESYKVFTKMNVREDAIELIGFYDKEEKEMFELLTKVSSIGPKSALAILSSLSVSQIRNAVLTSDIDTLTQAPGVGKKTASRIVLELVDTIKKQGYLPSKEETKSSPKLNDDARVAIDALVNLGYARNESEKAVSSVLDKDQTLEDIIKAALRKL